LSAVRTQDEHVSNPPSNPRDAHASSSQRGPPPRRAPPSSVEQDQEAQHSRRNYGIAESQPPAGRSAFPTTGSSGLAAERAGYNTESVLARTSSTQIIFVSFRIDPKTSIGMSRICISMGDSLGCAHTSSVPASVVPRSADLAQLLPAPSSARNVFYCSEDGTQTLSAESSSTPATSVVNLTCCNPAFLPGRAWKSSRN
jgi:hypothetical protein